jgi:N-acetylmuramoyl-L-alanine amidase|tara:strand:+ start:2102 stop:2827 length:726 start_codon:yes stop_codon:yes gene_type:complete
MTEKTTTSLKFTSNFDQKKRKISKIKFLIFHYTGMVCEKKAINRLCDQNSKVSCHYFIKKNGVIIKMLPESYIAWHAGKSEWLNFKNLNKHSIGIEIQNPGHQHGYKCFTKKQILSTIKISKIIINKFKIKNKFILGHSDIAPDRKKDPGEKFPWFDLRKYNIGIWHNLDKKQLLKLRSKPANIKEQDDFIKLLKKIGYSVKNKKNSIKAYQRRFRQDKITGIIDKECLEIIKNIAPYFDN